MRELGAAVAGVVILLRILVQGTIGAFLGVIAGALVGLGLLVLLFLGLVVLSGLTHGPMPNGNSPFESVAFVIVAIVCLGGGALGGFAREARHVLEG